MSPQHVWRDENYLSLIPSRRVRISTPYRNYGASKSPCRSIRAQLRWRGAGDGVVSKKHWRWPQSLGRLSGISHVELNRAKSEWLPGGCSSWSPGGRAPEVRVERLLVMRTSTGKRVRCLTMHKCNLGGYQTATFLIPGVDSKPIHPV